MILARGSLLGLSDFELPTFAAAQGGTSCVESRIRRLGIDKHTSRRGGPARQP